MIVSCAEAPDFLSSVTRMSGGDPFACRIISLYNSYSPELAFVDYWLTCDENGVCTGAIARNGSNFILLLTDKSDLGEISSFMRVAGASAVLMNGRYTLDFAGNSTEGVVMKTTAPIDMPEREGEIVSPEIKDAYDLIVKCAGEGFLPPVFEDFYVDVNHKLRHGAMRLCGLEVDGKLAAVAMTVAESPEGVVLGAVACDPEYRRRGCGSTIVSDIVNGVIAENKTVYLHRAKNANAGFYARLGFEDCGSWREYRS